MNEQKIEVGDYVKFNNKDWTVYSLDDCGVILKDIDGDSFYVSNYELDKITITKKNGSEGLKFDNGKLDYSLLSPEFICTLLPFDFFLDDVILRIKMFFNNPSKYNMFWLYTELLVTYNEEKEYTDILQEVVKVGMHGAEKYSRDNWRKVDINRYKAAFWRHLIAFLNGETTDPDSGFPHMSHVFWNIMIIYELSKKPYKIGIDLEYKEGSRNEEV